LLAIRSPPSRHSLTICHRLAIQSLAIIAIATLSPSSILSHPIHWISLSPADPYALIFPTVSREFFPRICFYTVSFLQIP
jgi:hypothetical protein